MEFRGEILVVGSSSSSGSSQENSIKSATAGSGIISSATSGGRISAADSQTSREIAPASASAAAGTGNDIKQGSKIAVDQKRKIVTDNKKQK